MHLSLILILAILASSAAISLASDTSPQTPSVAFLNAGNVLASFRANDASERIFIASSLDGKSFGPSRVLFGGVERTFVTPGLFELPATPFGFQIVREQLSILVYMLTDVYSLRLDNSLAVLDSTTRRIKFSQNINANGVTWTPPAFINDVDTTSDTPVATYDPSSGAICIFFRGRTTSNIYFTCSTSF